MIVDRVEEKRVFRNIFVKVGWWDIVGASDDL